MNHEIKGRAFGRTAKLLAPLGPHSYRLKNAPLGWLAVRLGCQLAIDARLAELDTTANGRVERAHRYAVRLFEVVGHPVNCAHLYRTVADAEIKLTGDPNAAGHHEARRAGIYS